MRSIAQCIASEIHPLNNLRVLQRLERDLGHNDVVRKAWIQHWVTEGFSALEKVLQDGQTGEFCHGDSPTIADCCLVPQVFNAERFGVSLDEFPTIQRINARCLTLREFQVASPASQPDAE